VSLSRSFDGPIPRSGRTTDCVKFVVSVLNSDLEGAGAKPWTLKRKKNLSDFCEVNPWNIVVES
jgi:hypothetical protein